LNVNEIPELKGEYARKDSKDTVVFDAVAEKVLAYGNECCPVFDSLFRQNYGVPGVIITEERGKFGDVEIRNNTPVIISDPTDRSSYLERIITEHGHSCRTMGDVFDAELERIGEAHARVEGCNTSFTLLKDNDIKYSIILNLFTGEVFLAYEKGVFSGEILKNDSIDSFTQTLDFKTGLGMNILFYTKEEKYQNNSRGTHLDYFDLDSTIKSPGGPIRFTYLLQEEERNRTNDINLIAHNGEKIQESLPNIAVAYFSGGNLKAYKMLCERKFVGLRGDKLLTPNFRYSIYNEGGIERAGIDLSFLNFYDYPSEFRDTTIIVPKANHQALTMLKGMEKKGYAIPLIE